MSLPSSIPVHSAAVHITLRAGGEERSIAQMGPDFIILRAAPREAIPSGPALITLTVDGTAEDIPVHLPEGIASGHRRALIAEEAAALAGV